MSGTVAVSAAMTGEHCKHLAAWHPSMSFDREMRDEEMRDGDARQEMRDRRNNFQMGVTK